MRLIIRHYLSLLKESGELDALLPDILLAKGIHPISKPQVGARQYGVDIAAVGRDPKDGIKKLFLFTVKPGDLGRSDWDNTSSQAVRPSLIDILDNYVPTHISTEHRNLPVKIVVVVGGELKQTLQFTWAQFTDKHSAENDVEFGLWDGDQLAIFIEQDLLNEHLLPPNCRKLLRKAISFAGEPNYDLMDFYELLNQLFVDVEIDKPPKKRRVCSRQIRTAILCNLVFSRWAEDEENLKHAFLASERLVLKTWDYLRRHELFDNEKLNRDFFDCYSAFHWASNHLFQKIQGHCYIQDGLLTRGGERVEHPLRVFEFIGIIGLIGLDQCYLAHSTDNAQNMKHAQIICEALKNLIAKNPIANSPAYDNHANDICIALMLLIATGSFQFAKDWIGELISRIAFGYGSQSDYPIATDSFEDLLALQMNKIENPEKLKYCSTLLPMLAEFCVVLADDELYQSIVAHRKSEFKDLNFQTWVPDEETEEFLYWCNAGYASGICFNSIQLPDSVDDFRTSLIVAMENTVSADNFSCFKYGMPILSSMSSRHFRTPPLPSIWRNPFFGDNKTTSETTESVQTS